MSDLIQLTDAEIDLVSGGYSYIDQSNSSSISQSASASNSYSPVTATASYGSLAVAVGAEATNSAVVSQANVVKFRYYY
jgi:hypothetical protein